MKESKLVKREILESVTFSIEEAASMSGISSSKIKNICSGRKNDVAFKGISHQDFDINCLEQYEEEGIDFVVDIRGSYPRYRVFFHGMNKLINHYEHLTPDKEEFQIFIYKEREKLKKRAELLTAMEEKWKNFLI